MESKIWVVYGQDVLYGGLHGMNEKTVFEGTKQEALDYAEFLSEEVINSYSTIYNTLEEDIKAECIFQGIPTGIDLEVEENIRLEIYQNDMDYGCIELDINKLPTLDVEELDNMLFLDGEDFINKYKID